MSGPRHTIEDLMRIYSALTLALSAFTSPLSAQVPAPIAPAAPAAPAGPTAGELVQQCYSNITNGLISDPVCTGYLAGFVGAVRIAETVSLDLPICLPEEAISNDSIMADVSAYLEENLENIDRSARSVVFLVLTKRYPCPEPTPISSGF